jgi:hypothetical protein
MFFSISCAFFDIVVGIEILEVSFCETFVEFSAWTKYSCGCKLADKRYDRSIIVIVDKPITTVIDPSLFVIYSLHLVFVMSENPAGLDQILKYPVLVFLNGSSWVSYRGA